MQIDIYETDDQLVGTVELDAPPPIGAILKFAIPNVSVIDRYRVRAIEYVFSTEHVGEAVKTLETRLVDVRCLVEQISHETF